MFINKHYSHLPIMLVLLVFSTIACAVNSDDNKSERSQFEKAAQVTHEIKPKQELVLFVKWGKGKSEIEFRTHDNKSPRSYFEKPVAANSFWISSNGEIYILDGGERIKIYKNGSYVRHVNLPQLGFYEDFVVLDEAFVLNTSHKVYKVTFDGKVVNEKRVFGLAKPNSAISELILINGKIAFTADMMVTRKSDLAPVYRCLSEKSLEVVDCAPNTNLLAIEQILDTDGTMYLSHDFDSGVLKITPLSGGRSYLTNINTDSYINKFDGKYGFMCSKTFRLRGDYLYYVITGNDGLRIERIRYKNS